MAIFIGILSVVLIFVGLVGFAAAPTAIQEIFGMLGVGFGVTNLALAAVIDRLTP